MAEPRQAGELRTPSLFDALIPLVALAVLIAGSLALFGLGALDGPIQVALIVCCAVASLIALKNGHRWALVQEFWPAGPPAVAPALQPLTVELTAYDALLTEAQS